MSTDPKRIGTDPSITDLYNRVRALERRAAGAAGIDYLFVQYQAAAGLASSTALTTLSLQPGSSPVSWGTSDATLFDLQDDGGGFYAITFLQNGLYLAFASVLFPFNIAPGANTIARIGLTGAGQQVAGNDSELIVPNLAGTAWGAEPSRVSIFNLPAAYGAPPLYSHLQVGQNSGNTSQVYLAEVFVARIDDAGNTDF